jgi:hypothetical protein
MLYPQIYTCYRTAAEHYYNNARKWEVYRCSDILYTLALVFAKATVFEGKNTEYFRDLFSL